MTTTPTIRLLRKDDWAPWQQLWCGYLAFYRQQLADGVTERNGKMTVSRGSAD